MQHEVDIAIIGAGPAGAALASALAGAYRVLLIDRWEKPPQKIGESLIPAARRLLRDLHLLDAVAARGYPEYVGNRSYWGSAAAETRDSIRDPDGLGWHLDREDFDLMLRQEAVRRGAHLLAPARLGEVARDGRRWSVSADTRDGTHTVRARILVDASGRSAVLAKRLRIKRRVLDHTVAHWISGVDKQPGRDGGLSTIAAAPDGWWYTAGLNRVTGKRVLAFHTDPGRQIDDLVGQATGVPAISELLDETAFQPDGAVTRAAAGTTHLDQMSGPGWIAIGDAGLSLDPLSSRGLFHALYTALAGAACCDHALQSGDLRFGDFTPHTLDIARTYMRHLQMFYSAEQRWPDAAFWRRRHRVAAAA